MARCLLVSNRLPLTFDHHSSKFVPSSGGLVSAIRGLNPTQIGLEFHWMGILTDDVSKEQIDQIKLTKFGDIKCYPIIAPKTTYQHFYNRYCNNVLWPLFHYERSLVHNSPLAWKSYLEINKIVAEAIDQEANDDDTIWVHDFHLMLVPQFLKEKRPELKVGFFLHIPFPSSEIFRELPQRQDILHSLLKCDLIGFHDLSYLTHFKTGVSRIFGESLLSNSERKLGVYPISIDTPYFGRLAIDPQTLSCLKNYKDSKAGMKWVLGVDRLDYIKGLILKLKAFREFLKTNRDQIGHVQMLQVVIPSRTDVQDYQFLKDRIEQLVSSINGEFGTLTYMPIHYLYHAVNDFELSALFQVSDVLHVGSRRDGMNLVSLEYVASQPSGSEGTILLSEFTGAHSTLSYAFSINPWDIEGTAKKMLEALQSNQEFRSTKMQSMQQFLKNYTSTDWAQVFLRDLHRQVSLEKDVMPVSSEGLFSWMKNLSGKNVLFFCDLDGTLLPFVDQPSDATMSDRTAKVLKEISENDHFHFVIVSGRDKDFLEAQFLKRRFNFSMGACHGAYAYSNKTLKWENLIPNDGSNWRQTVFEILKIYTTRTPGSFIEDKAHAITWHYRNSPSGFADFLANKLYSELEENLISYPVQVVRGKKIIEIKSILANKGHFVTHWISQIPEDQKPDVIVALGDDTTDEDMFRALQEQDEITAYCIKVGHEDTVAQFYIKDQTTVDPLLEKMIKRLGGISNYSAHQTM